MSFSHLKVHTKVLTWGHMDYSIIFRFAYFCNLFHFCLLLQTI